MSNQIDPSLNFTKDQKIKVAFKSVYSAIKISSKMYKSKLANNGVLVVSLTAVSISCMHWESFWRVRHTYT